MIATAPVGKRLLKPCKTLGSTPAIAEHVIVAENQVTLDISQGPCHTQEVGATNIIG